MATAITQHTDSLFKIDGVPYAKVYEVEISSNKVLLKNTGNRKTVRLGDFKDISIDGTDYTDIAVFRDDLSELVFKKGGGTGEGVQTPTEIAEAIYVDEAAALAGGLTSGQYYHTGDYIIRIIQ